MPPERVALFVTCLVDLLYPEIGDASVALLREAGVEVSFPEEQTCCGQPPLNAGFPDEARGMARTLLDAFEDAEAVVAPSGSCVAMVRARYPALFDGTPDEARARALASKTFELTEFVVDEVGVTSFGGRLDATVTYHDACHGLRELGLKQQARALLSGIEGLDLVEMPRAEACCGFGGTFSLSLPEMATAMADDKLAQAGGTGADVLVAGDAGCLMHLSGRGSRSSSGPTPMHVAVLLAKAKGLT